MGNWLTFNNNYSFFLDLILWGWWILVSGVDIHRKVVAWWNAQRQFVCAWVFLWNDLGDHWSHVSAREHWSGVLLLLFLTDDPLILVHMLHLWDQKPVLLVLLINFCIFHCHFYSLAASYYVWCKRGTSGQTFIIHWSAEVHLGAWEIAHCLFIEERTYLLDSHLFFSECWVKVYFRLPFNLLVFVDQNWSQNLVVKLAEIIEAIFLAVLTRTSQDVVLTYHQWHAICHHVGVSVLFVVGCGIWSSYWLRRVLLFLFFFIFFCELEFNLVSIHVNWVSQRWFSFLC